MPPRGDELYLIGFSRAAYSVRAFAGLVGASGIQRPEDPQTFETAWSHYRVSPRVREAAQCGSRGAAIEAYRASKARGEFYARRAIKCVGVFDTVDSYGVPAGFGLTALGRYWALFSLGFHDTTIGDHIEFGLHALGVDERRRPFVPTFWTAPKKKPPTSAPQHRAVSLRLGIYNRAPPRQRTGGQHPKLRLHALASRPSQITKRLSVLGNLAALVSLAPAASIHARC